MKMFGLKTLAIGTTTFLAASALVPLSASAINVDREIFLSVDVSGSVNDTEFASMQNGYVSAFRDPSVIRGIESSSNGIGIALQYWSETPDTIIGNQWYILKNSADSNAFADLIANTPRPSSLDVGSLTGIANALNAAATELANNGLDALDSTIIDISGDGQENVSSDLDLANARMAALAEADIINGLPIGGSSIENYYINNIIGGTGSQVFAAASFADFEASIIEKLAVGTTVNDVPFEFSPTLGIFVSLGLFGGHYWRKKKATAVEF